MLARDVLKEEINEGRDIRKEGGRTDHYFREGTARRGGILGKEGMSRRKERRKGGVTWDSAVLACGFTKTNAEFCNVAMSTVLILMMPMRDIAVYG